MYDLQFILEKLETTDHAAGDSAQDILRDARTLELVERASIHVLHAIINARFYKESAVEFDNLWGNGAVEDIEFHDDGV